MPFTSKSTACTKAGKVKKGYREVACKNGSVKYMTDNVKKSYTKEKKDKPIKKEKKEKKEKMVRIVKNVIEDKDDDELKLPYPRYSLDDF